MPDDDPDPDRTQGRGSRGGRAAVASRLATARVSDPPRPGPGSGARSAVQDLQHVADRHKEPEVRQALRGAVELIVELIEERARRHGLDDRRDRPHDGG